MTPLQRQYSSPNCKLILLGFSDASTSPYDKRPPLSQLMNAECHFVGYPQPITGGRDFFESLIQEVSQYAQGFLSGISVPESSNGQREIVKIQMIDENLHRLRIQDSNYEQTGETPPETPAENTPLHQIDLNTVQLFDLVEAVDQFFSDTRTLPELTLQLRPFSRKTRKAEKPVTEKAIPAAIGISSLAVAAIALFFVPVPEVRRPTEPVPQSQDQTETLETPNASGSATPPLPPPTGTETSVASLESNLTSFPAINDPVEVERLQALLTQEIDRQWVTVPRFTEALIYRVSVAPDGAIVGYKAISDVSSTQEGQIPLPQLLYRPVGTRTPDEPIADYQVTFNPDGILEVKPWNNSQN